MATYAPVDGSRLAGALGANSGGSRSARGRAREWRIREVGDGNLNLVFIVEGNRDGVVVKQALPYVRLVGEAWPLPLERSWFEFNALTEQARHAPRLTPEVFHFDRAQAMIVMEYLRPHVIMRKGLIRGIEYPRFADDIAEFLAATLFNTSALAGTAAGAQGARGTVRARTRPCARSPRISSSPTLIARRRSTAGPVPGSTPRSWRSSATAR